MGSKLTFKLLCDPKVWIGLIVLAVLSSSVTSACSKGCLSCDKDKNKCTVCDPLLKYQLDEEGSCVLVTLDKCKVSDPLVGEPKCLQCDSGMLFDFEQKKCVEVPSNKEISDCKDYNQAAECVNCEQDFYISNGDCLPAAIEVEGCLVFTEANFCAVCKKNMRFDENTGKCVDFTTVSNCGSHSFATCDECLKGYYQESNFFYNIPSGPLDPNSYKNFVFYNNDLSFEGNFRTKAHSGCTYIKYTNCLTYASTDGKVTGCATCGVGRYLNTTTQNCDSYPAVQIKFCKVYSNSSTCYQCNEKYYLDGNECKAITEVPDCAIYKRTENKCEKCIDEKYLDESGSTSCKARAVYPIPSCTTHTINADECTTCETTFIRTDEKKACLAKIENCNQYEPSPGTPTELLCKKCNINYFVPTDKKSCTVQKIDNCKDYVENEDSCDSCYGGFYKTGTTKITCAKKELAGCLTYVSEQENKCQTCKNLFSLTNDTKTCVALTDTKCARNITNQTDCVSCQKGHYLNGSKECVESKKTYDDLCTEVTDDGKCIMCKYGYVPFALEGYFKTLPSGCAKANSGDQNCTMCAPDMDPTDDSGNITCASAANKTGKCKQVKETIKEALADNDTKCALCRNQTNHYLTGNTCTDRSPYTKHNCALLSENTDKCETCTEGTHPINISNESPVCLDPPTAFTLTAMDRCRVMNFFEDKKCITCENGNTKVEGDPDACNADGGDAPHDWDLHHVDVTDNLKITKGLPKGATAINNCVKHYYSYTDSKLYCAECKDTFTPIVEMMSTGTSVNFTVDNNNFLISSSLNRIVECKTMTDADYMRYEAGTALSIASSCKAAFDYGTLASEDPNYICVSCGVGNVGTPKLFNFDKTGASATGFSSPSMGIPVRIGYGACASNSDVSVTNKYFKHLNMEDSLSITFNDVVYDTCSDTTKNVVHLRQVMSSKFFILGVEGPPGNERPNVVCQEIPAKGKIDNCQVYTLETLADDNRDLALEENYTCLLCKPGFYMKSWTKCLPIENCDLTKTNTWNSACQTCDDGFSWPMKTSDKFPDVTKCQPNESSTENSCMISQSTNKQCVLCKPGKTYNKTTKKCENYPSYCGSNGFPMTDLNDPLDEDLSGAAGQEAFQAIFISMFLDNYKLGPGLCATCAGSKKLYMAKDTTDKNKKVCVSNTMEVSIVEGCKVYKGDNLSKCKECKPEYILKSNDTCTLRSGQALYKNCLLLSDTMDCDVCMEGYIRNNPVGVNPSECVQDHNCLTSPSELENGNQCTLCKDGYRRNSLNKWKCDPIDDSNPCLRFGYDGSREVCLKCKDCRQTPVRSAPSGTETNIYCVNHQSNVDLSNYKLMYNNNGGYHLGVTDTLITKTPSGKFFTMNFEDESAYPRYACVRGPVDYNCTQFNTTNFYECTSCKEGFYLDTGTKRCKKGEMMGCKIYNSENSCNTCHTVPVEESNWKSYYKSLSSCYMNTSTNCVTYSSSSNACVTCRNGYHLESNKCKPNVKATNCAKAVTNTDECVLCSEKYYKNGSNLCSPHTVTNCNGYETDSNACKNCQEGFYKSSGNCLTFTAPNCATKESTSNACSSCTLPTEYRNGEKGCVTHETMTGCKTYNSSSWGCAECDDGYYRSGSSCYANPTGIENCTVYTSATTCTQCASTHFFDGTECKTVTSTVSECAVYSADGVCSACNANHLKNEDGTTCTSVVENSCLTWTDTENCASCAGNNVLKTNGDSKVQCVPSGLDHCLTPVAGDPKNTCTKCSDGFILRNAECHSPKISIQDCRVYDVTTEDCVDCYPGKVLSADKKQCLSKIAEAGEYCARAHIESDENPTCNVCKFGFTKNSEGKCEACGGEGCFMCDLSDLTKCRICATDYYMSSSGTCSLNNPPEPTSVAIVCLLSMIAFVLLMLDKE